MASLALETSWAAILHLLVTLRRDYLTQEELRARLDEHMATYYRFLGKSVLLRRDLNFWNYHKAQLAAAGLPLNRGRVAMGVLRYLLPMDPARRLRRGSARR